MRNELSDSYEATDKRLASATVWLKPGRIKRPLPGVAITVLRTNGPDAQVAISLDESARRSEDCD